RTERGSASRSGSSDDPPSTILEPHVALGDESHPGVAAAAAIDVARQRSIVVRAVTRAARRPRVQDLAEIDEPRGARVLGSTVALEVRALGLAGEPFPGVHGGYHNTVGIHRQ